MTDHDKTCVMRAIKIIGSKWTILILRELCENKKRFNELQRSLQGISPKTLSLRLKELEEEGIVQKKIFAEVPLHVEYSLTRKGQSLRDIIDKMREWGEKVG
ncbi:MAG: helix-turn-helix transcriptional regulator [Candidatus Levybacteria bacterium]|nr:helix-turn-helix transcriptional regulator [Candidatus Levybacteria bacterium]